MIFGKIRNFGNFFSGLPLSIVKFCRLLSVRKDNWKNKHSCSYSQVLNGDDPVTEELGPYVYSATHMRRLVSVSKYI